MTAEAEIIARLRAVTEQIRQLRHDFKSTLSAERRTARVTAPDKPKGGGKKR